MVMLVALGTSSRTSKKRPLRSPRERLLAAARSVIRERGALGFSLRETATRAGMRAPSVYEHFGSREEILDALRGETIAALQASIVAQLQGRPATDELVAMALAYVAFAEKNPEDFVLCFVDARDTLRTLDAGLPKSTVLAIAVDAIERALSRGELNDPTGLGALGIAYALWTMAHGMAMVRVAYLSGLQADLAPANEAALRAFVGAFAPPKRVSRKA